ncbi:MAG TPA: Gfo/Idh/MocA family oxidoreductase, partial [Flavisolibacter sp.]|nr:Gfo/Idh/MocA family oxidoreductase [Flavisolibacter sp.]
IIGCGNVTEVKSGPAFQKVPQSHLAAVMRRSEDKVKDYAERHGVKTWYTNADDLINDPAVNAVYVATPPDSHEEYAIKAMQAGKPVYLEKPMAIHTDAAQRIVAIAKETGVKLSIAHYRRQQPLFLKIKSLLDEKAIGDVRFVNMQFFRPDKSETIAQTEVPWRLNPQVSGGGLFYDLAPHQLDLMLYFFGKPEAVSGISRNSAGLYAADDTTCGQIVFNKGIVFNGAWCFAVPVKKDCCEIIGTKGTIRFSVFDHQPVELTVNDKVEQLSFEPLQHVQQPMIQKVVEYFLDASPNPCSGEEGMKVMRMMDAMTNYAAG